MKRAVTSMCALLFSERQRMKDDLLDKVSMYFGHCFATDGEYTDAEMVGVMSKIIKKTPEDITKIIREL